MNPCFKERQTLELGEYRDQVEKRLKSWKEQNFARWLWAKDHTLWFSEPQPEIQDRLGWLEMPERMQERLEDFTDFARIVRDEDTSHVVLLGMGGSSLAPEIFQKTFGNAPGYPQLIVLDSTHPGSIGSVEKKLDFPRTMFLISSKSGTTLETLSLFRYFWKRVSLLTDKPGDHFVAITDPGTPLMKTAEERHFRKVFKAPVDVGGRYSALTDFGLVPAALIGMDIHRLLDRTLAASENSASCVSEGKASALILGASLGELAVNRDKLTFLSSDSLRSFPDWIEQLIAESTGKDGKGILPVVNEPLVLPDAYGNDRFFVYLCLEGEESRELTEFLSLLERAGHAVICINMAEKYDLGQEIFRWEVAVASACSVLGIHPFNQPDVQLTKDLTRKLMEEKEDRGGKIRNHQETLSVQEPDALAKGLENWISQAQSGDYIALQVYLSPNEETTEALQGVRFELLKSTGLATTLGYGPRFLHSTGQMHKGGPNNGLFLQIVDEPAEDIAIPETEYTFGALIQAQAIGDYQALLRRGRRVLRVNLEKDVLGACEQLRRWISQQT